MKGRRHSPEQIVRKLREADQLLAEGADVDAICRHLEVSVQTYQRWRSQFKAMRAEDVVRLKVAWTPSRSTLQAAVFCRRCPSSHVRRTSVGGR